MSEHESEAWVDRDLPSMPRNYEKVPVAIQANVTLADLQVEAIRGVLEELLTGTASTNPGVWGPQLLGQLSRILDMTEPLDVMAILSEQEEAGLQYERELETFQRTADDAD